jgi:acetyl esterase/lipase
VDGTKKGLVHRCIEDAAAVVRYVTTKPEWGLGAARLVYSGYSAGGHLAWMIAVASAVDKVDNTHPDIYIAPPTPMAVVSFAGAGLDVLDNDPQMRPSSRPHFINAWGAAAQWRRWSPGAHIADGRAPCCGLIVQGTRDQQLPREPAWAQRFYDGLQAAGWYDVRLVWVPDADHYAVEDPAVVPIEDWCAALCKPAGDLPARRGR